MNAAHRFNGLNGSVATREELQQLVYLANDQEQSFVAKKLANLLAKNPEETKFKINLIENAIDIAPESILHCFDCETDFTDEELEGLGRVEPDDIYQMMTDKMIEAIKNATGAGYKKRWKDGYATDAKGNPLEGYLIPFNFVSKKPYRGINQWLLSNLDGLIRVPLENPFYLTFKQIQKLGGKLVKGSKAREVVYFTILYKIKTDHHDFATYDENRFADYLLKKGFPKEEISSIVFNSKIPILKYYNVFNGADIEGIDFDLQNFKTGYVIPERKGVVQERIELAELIKSNYPEPQPKYKEGNSDRAFYTPASDRVTMPHIDSFETSQDYYRVLFYEYIHSTGNFRRLDRDFSGNFGSKSYAKEELVAEFGAVFLSAHAGIIWHTDKNHAEYLRNWHAVLGIIKDDNRFLMRAASDAQKATDFILNLDSEGVAKYLKEVGKAVDISPKEPKTTVLPGTSKGELNPKEPKTTVLPGTSKGELNPKGFDKKPTYSDESLQNQKNSYALFDKLGVPIEISTDAFKNMSVVELRKFTLDFYNQNLKGRVTAIQKHLKEVSFVTNAGKKIARGVMYKEKAAVIESLEALIKSSTYNNWGERKQNDSRDVLGYLNFKSKLTIDGIKRHVRISIVLDKQRNTKLKNIEVGAKEKSDKAKAGSQKLVPQDDIAQSLSKDKDTKKGFAKPKSNPLIMNMSEKPNKDVEYFNISGDFGKFLGKVERKPVDSVAITLDAPQGAGKTRFFFYAMNEMAKSGYKCLFVSLEEHPLSDLFQQKKNKYIDKKNQNNIDVVGELPNGYQDLKSIIDQYDCIFIDSWGKLAELENIDFDRDLRKKFNSKLFFVIFQRTVTGTMRGGARSQFDGDIIMKIEKDDTGNFKNNFAFHDKNRYQSIELDKLKFNTYTHKLIKEPKPTKTKTDE